jgi:hypothetical protein
MTVAAYDAAPGKLALALLNAAIAIAPGALKISNTEAQADGPRMGAVARARLSVVWGATSRLWWASHCERRGTE